MAEAGPKKAWFVLELTYGEAKALRSQIGDLPRPRTGPRLAALYRQLDARLHLAGSIDDGAPQLTVVREKPVPPPKKDRWKKKYPKLAPRTPPEHPCPACHGEGIVGGVICAPCEGFGEMGPP